MGKADITKPLLSSRQHPIYLKSCQLHLPNRSGTWLLPASISSPPLASSHPLLQKPPVLLSSTVHLFSPSGTSDSYKSQQFPITRRSQLVQELSVLPRWKAGFLTMDCEVAWCFCPPLTSFASVLTPVTLTMTCKFYFGRGLIEQASLILASKPSSFLQHLCVIPSVFILCVSLNSDLLVGYQLSFSNINKWNNMRAGLE